MTGHPAQVQATPADVYLALDDGGLAASLIGAMSVDPKPRNFAAFGRIIRAGVDALGKGELELVIRRGR